MGLTKLLGEFNGIFIGTFLGISAYVSLVGTIGILGFIEATLDIGGYAFGAATSTMVTSRVTEYPLGPIWAGILGGAVGVSLALYAPFALSTPIVSRIIEQIVTGLIAGGVIGILTRFLPGL